MIMKKAHIQVIELGLSVLQTKVKDNWVLSMQKIEKRRFWQGCRDFRSTDIFMLIGLILI